MIQGGIILKKIIKKVFSTLAAIAILSSSFVAMQASAEDVPYLNIYNSQGTWGAGDNKIACQGTRVLVNDDPVMGSYSTLTGSFVHVCEGSNDVASLWADNIEAGRMTVVEADFMPDANTQFVHLYTFYTNKMTYSVDLTTLGDVVKVGEWNHIKVLADTSIYGKSNNGWAADRIPSAIWVNGTQVLSFNVSKYGTSGLKIATIRERIAAGAAQYIRLRFDAKEGTTTTVGIDNTTIKTVDADSVYDVNYNDYFLKANSEINTTSTLVGGLAGKADTDKAYAITQTTDNGYIENYVPSGKKYVKQEFDILPGEGFRRLYVKSRNQHLTMDVVGLINESNQSCQRLKLDQWNHITIISEINTFNIETGECEITSDTYVNGIDVGLVTRKWSSAEAAYLDFTDGAGQGRTYFPIRLGHQAAGVTTYYDNINISVSNEKPNPLKPIYVSDVNGVVSTSACTRYENAKLTIPEGESVMVSDLTLDGGYIRAYEDSSMESELDSDLVLEEGNFVVATDANGIVTYYDVEQEVFVERNETVLDINFDDETYTGKAGKVTTPKGIYEFVSDDKGGKAVSVSNKAEAYDGYLEFEPVDISLPNYLISFNVKPISAYSYINIGSAQSATISPLLKADVLKQDKWNKVDLVVTRTSTGDVEGYATVFPVTVTTYVNGVEVSKTNHTPKASGDNKTLLRFNVQSANVETTSTVLFDDIKVTQANVELTPELNVPASITSASFTMDGSPADRVDLVEGTYTYSITIDNPSNEVFEATPIMALFDLDDRLIDVAMTSVSVDAGDKDSASVSLDVTEVDGSYIKTFVWNGAAGMLPLPTPSDKLTVACWGDSLTFGQGAHVIGGMDESYPKVLGDLTGYEVYNMGVPGETVTTFASRQGAVDILTQNSFTIPAGTTPVVIDFYGYDKDHTTPMGMIVPRDVRAGGWTPVTIAGVEGVLSCTINNDVWPRALKSATFTRSTPGEAVNVKEKTQIFPSSLEVAAKADVNVIYGLSNGGWNNSNGGASDSNYADLVALYRRMINNSKDPSKYVVVLYGSGVAHTYAKTNQALRDEFGTHTVDAETYLRSDQAFADAGIEKTAKDVEYLNQGYLPYSFLNDPENDKSHMNAIGYARLAHIVYEKMVELGYAK